MFYMIGIKIYIRRNNIGNFRIFHTWIKDNSSKI